MRHALCEFLKQFRVLLVVASMAFGAVLPAPTSHAAKAVTPVPAVTEGKAAAKPVSHQGKRRYYLRRGKDALVLAQADYEWRHDGKRYELRNVIETVGVLAALKPTRTVQESRGELGKDGLRPAVFNREKKGKTDTAKFDWKAGTVSYRDERAPLLAGTQDLLSLYVQLAWRAPHEGSIEIPIVTGSKLETYRITVSGEEKLLVDKRSVNVVRVFAQTEDERIDFWLAKPVSAASVSGAAAANTKAAFPIEMPLPLRIQVTDKSGTVYDQSLNAPADSR